MFQYAALLFRSIAIRRYALFNSVSALFIKASRFVYAPRLARRIRAKYSCSARFWAIVALYIFKVLFPGLDKGDEDKDATDYGEGGEDDEANPVTHVLAPLFVRSLKHVC